jgi:hypothetical protein
MAEKLKEKGFTIFEGIENAKGGMVYEVVREADSKL